MLSKEFKHWAIERQKDAGTINNPKRRALALRKTLEGFQIDLNPVPEKIVIGQRAVERLHREGHVDLINPRRRVHFGGSLQQPKGKHHNFLCCDEIVFITIHGDYYYRVTHQPGKYVAEARAIAKDQVANATDIARGFVTRVDHFFRADLREVDTNGRLCFQYRQGTSSAAGA